jgi:four helix bundle protein
MTLTSFKELKCWKAAVELRTELKPKIDAFPIEEKYRLKDQLIRALRSVTNNIAEGYGRYHFQENIQFCRQSRGSLTEIQDHLITQSEFDFFDGKIENCLALLNGYINYLIKAKQT